MRKHRNAAYLPLEFPLRLLRDVSRSLAIARFRDLESQLRNYTTRHRGDVLFIDVFSMDNRTVERSLQRFLQGALRPYMHAVAR